jgi:AcrR family transcriptional regulator
MSSANLGGHLGMTTGAARTQQRGSLTRDLIIQRAFARLDEQGPGALSMRRLADHLGIAPNALYTHVRGKADLIDGLIDQVYAGIDPDLDLTKDWPEQLAAISQAVRTQFLAHPAVVPFALQQPGLGPNSLRLGEAIYGVLRPAGFSDEATVGIVYALLTYILGFVALELPRAGTSPQTSDEFVRRLHGFFAALPPGEFPTPSSSPPCWQGSPPTTSSSSASASSWPASKPSNRHPSTRPNQPPDPRPGPADASLSRQGRLVGGWFSSAARRGRRG